MPRWPKKTAVEPKEAAVAVAEKPVKVEPVKVEKKVDNRSMAEVPRKEMTDEERRIDTQKSLKEPLAPGQGFFESPEGFIMVGEADKDRIWCPWSNGGRGMWINPRRG